MVKEFFETELITQVVKIKKKKIERKRRKQQICNNQDIFFLINETTSWLTDQTYVLHMNFILTQTTSLRRRLP